MSLCCSFPKYAVIKGLKIPNQWFDTVPVLSFDPLLHYQKENLMLKNGSMLKSEPSWWTLHTEMYNFLETGVILQYVL